MKPLHLVRGWGYAIFGDVAKELDTGFVELTVRPDWCSLCRV